MGSAIAWVMLKTGFGENAARLALTAALFVAVLAALAGVWAAVKHDIIRDHEAKIARRAAPATDKAAAERAADAIANARTEQEMHDAIAAQPDQPISPTSRALACQRLRHAGKHPAACS